jgi:hypothetical protein
MRSCAIYLLLLSSLVCAQTGSIKVKVSKGDRINKELWNTTFLFNQDTSFLESRSVFRNKSIFDSIPYGEYYIILQSDLGEKIKKTVQLHSNKTVMKFKEHKHYYSSYLSSQPFITKLQYGDTMTIDLDMSGCFGGYRSWADISYSNNVYSVRYTPDKQRDTILTTVLDSNKLTTLTAFEEDSLKLKLHTFSCTNRYYYTLQLGRYIYTTKRGCYDLIQGLTLNE